MLQTEPIKRQTLSLLSLCDLIEKEGTPEIRLKVKELKVKISKWDRRDNIETVS